jgi:hypothetical protein
MGTSLFSLVRVQRFTVMARSFSFGGSSAWTRNKNLESGRGVLNLTKVLAQAEKYDDNSGERSERLVIQDPTAAATKFCSQTGRMSIKIL